MLSAASCGKKQTQYGAYHESKKQENTNNETLPCWHEPFWGVYTSWENDSRGFCFNTHTHKTLLRHTLSDNCVGQTLQQWEIQYVDKRLVRPVLLVFASLGISTSHGWVAAHVCRVCMPISLEPGVGIQLTVPSSAGRTWCLALNPNGALHHFLSSWARWTPVVTVIERSQIFCDGSARCSCSYWPCCPREMPKLVFVSNYKSTSKMMVCIVKDL